MTSGKYERKPFMKNRRKVPYEKIQQFIRIGLSQRYTAELLGVSKTTVVHAMRKA